MDAPEHYCDAVESFPITKFFQLGTGIGKKVLILGEAPAPNGWRKSGKAFYTPENKLLPTGKNLNKLLAPFGLAVETCAFTEVVKCYPGSNRQLLKNCGPKCWPILLRQIQTQDYALILVLGVKTTEILRLLVKQDLTIGQIARITIGVKTYNILPIYHPSPVAHFNKEKNTIIFSTLAPQLHSLI